MKLRFLLSAAAMVGLYVLLFWPKPDGAATGRFLLITGGLLAAYFTTLWLGRRFSLLGRDRELLIALAGIAVLIRLAVVFGADDMTYLSRDVYRFVWEGKLVANGFNPYDVTPASPAGRELIDPIFYPHIANPEEPASHPPMAQFLFVLAYFLHSDSVHGFRMLSVLAELLTLLGVVLLAIPLIEQRPYRSWSVLIYAFSPLVMIEFLMSSHADILAVPFFVFALLLLRRDHAVGTGVLLALAALVEILAVAFVPVVFFHFRGHKKGAFLAGGLATAVLCYLPFLPGAGMQVLASLPSPFFAPEFNSSMFGLVAMVTGDEGTARGVVGVLFLLVVAAASYPLRERMPKVSHRLFLVAGAALILAPSVYPWNLIWVLPFLVLTRNTAFLVLTGTVVLGCHAFSGYFDAERAAMPGWLLAAEYGPFYLLLLWPVIRRRLSASGEAGRSTKENGPVTDRPA